MNLNTVFGTKIGQTQGFLENGKRVPLSCIHVENSTVTQVKNIDTDGYAAVQIAFGKRNKLAKSIQGHLKKAKLQEKPRFFREVRHAESGEVALGTEIKVDEVFKPGDMISVTGVSKGKGYAGVVKRHGFAGGPRTHGQSDRERAPGSIGQSTTPGRVYKGKKMAGRMGHAQVTIKNLVVVDIEGDTLFVKGLIPGSRGGVIKIVKIGEAKNYVPLFKERKEEEDKEEAADVSQEVSEGEIKGDVPAETPEEVKEDVSSVASAKDKEKTSEAQSTAGGDEEKVVSDETKEEQTEETKASEAQEEADKAKEAQTEEAKENNKEEEEKK